MRTFGFFMLLSGCVTMTVGCTEQPTKEGAAAKIDAAKEKVGEAVGKAGEKAGAAMEKAGEKAKDAMAVLGKEFSDAATKAKSALDGVQGGSEVLQKITDLFASAKEALQGITDSNAAQAATAKLGELDGKIDEISQSLKPLPEAAKTALSGLVEKGIVQIKALAEKARDLPGIAEEVKTKLNAFVDKLASLKS